MIWRSVNRKILGLVSCLLVLTCTPAFAYELFDLGAGVVPHDINNTGLIVGSYTNGQGQPTAFLFSIAAGRRSDLAGTAAYAVNDAGQIVGTTLVGAFLQQGGKVQSWDGFSAYGISENGQIAGSRIGVNIYRPWPLPYNPAVYDGSRWTDFDIAQVYPRGRRLGVYADIYQLGDINDSGYAVGSRRRYGLAGSSAIMISPPYSNIKTAADVTYLPTSGGGAAAINNSNIVVGSTGTRMAYIYDGTVVTTLTPLPGGVYSSAMDINDANTVVGSSGSATGNHAFVKESGGAMQDLNDLVNASGWVLVSALAINELGDIVGTGTLNGQSHGFLLANGTVAPTPSPASPSQPPTTTVPVPSSPAPPQTAPVVSPVPTNEAPVAVVMAENTTGKIPLEVNFKGSKSYDPDGSKLSYHWDFGDGASSTRRNPKHIYKRTGAFLAVLTVTDKSNISTQSSPVEIFARGIKK